MSKQFGVAVGDRVAYSVAFLRSIGMTHSSLAHEKGTITNVNGIVASIKWDNDGQERVAVANLAKVGPNPRYCQC